MKAGVATPNKQKTVNDPRKTRKARNNSIGCLIMADDLSVIV
jgi:hypothetical protein